jgi:hypothetical protein
MGWRMDSLADCLDWMASMGRHKRTTELVELAHGILSAMHPMTVRQCYYQLVSKSCIKNCLAQYQKVSGILVDARLEGVIPWEWIEDRLRRPHTVNMWEGLADFGEDCCGWYRLDVWETQPRYVEVWVEKDALSGIFEEVLEPYGVTLNVGRGYDGWSSIHNAAGRLRDRDAAILYFGDFDPSGEDMKRSLEDRLGQLSCHPEIVKCALTREDIERHRLPPALTKTTDKRARAFVAEHGDISVELDALPVEALKERLVEAVEARMDLSALRQVREHEEKDRKRLQEALQRPVGTHSGGGIHD